MFSSKWAPQKNMKILDGIAAVPKAGRDYCKVTPLGRCLSAQLHVLTE